jgi:hypothetical protein
MSNKKPFISFNMDRYDKRGNERCHAIGCCKNKNLQELFGGKFCERHVQQLSAIRCRLKYAKCSGNKLLEILCRQEEIELRKFCDAGHMMYQRMLECENPVFNDVFYSSKKD